MVSKIVIMATPFTDPAEAVQPLLVRRVKGSTGGLTSRRSPWEIDVWEWCFRDPLSEALLEIWAKMLTPEEQARAERFKFPKPREQFLRSRAMLRSVLMQELGDVPFEIVANAYGKPELAGRELHFNVSHSETDLVIAVADVPVGIDVETIREMPNAIQLVERYFHPTEQAQYFALPEHEKQAAFFRTWTCKEAVLKGIGCGTRDLDRCIADVHPHREARILGPQATAEAWQVLTWTSQAGNPICLALETKRKLYLNEHEA
jgi:4'-phosphopantetheinyl transferase